MERIAIVAFGDTISCPRLLEIMRADPRCRGVDLVKVRHGDGFMIVAGGVEVSYRTAIKRFVGNKHTRTRCKWIAAAARSTIQPQITAFRRANGAGADKDIDHIQTDFCQIWKDWLMSEGLEERQIRIKKIGKVFVLADGELRRSWYKFHKEHARLEAVDRREHRQRTRSRRILSE